MHIDGAALRSIRERAGKGQSHLSREARISQAHLSNLERGLRQASPEIAKRLAEALCVNIVALLPPDDESAFRRDPKSAVAKVNPAVVGQLRERIAGLKAQRDRYKAENAAYRKAYKAELKAHKAELADSLRELTKLSEHITRNKKRLAQLEKNAPGSGTSPTPGLGTHGGTAP
jgi:transcriptional regulator with XRE-family HTH domain